jgi:hypothetical protein
MSVENYHLGVGPYVLINFAVLVICLLIIIFL